MAKSPQKRLLEVHESSVRMNAAAADRCRSDTKKWTKWGEIDDPALQPQPRRKARKRRRGQQRTDQVHEPIHRVQAGTRYHRSRFASCSITLKADADG